MARFELVNLSVLCFNIAILPLLVELLDWPVLVSQLVFVSMTFMYSWYAHKGFSFRRRASELEPASNQQDQT